MRVDIGFRPRPVKVVMNDGSEPGLLHMIFAKSEIISPSLMVGGHSDGTVTYPCAVVELRNGLVTWTRIENIMFLDGEELFRDYFPEEELTGGSADGV